MLKTLAGNIAYDKDLPVRAHTLTVRMKTLSGKLYDSLAYAFYQERNSLGEYVPMRDRRPSARYNIARILVTDTVGMLFGDLHFPRICIAGNEDAEAAVLQFVNETGLPSIMEAAATRGSIGSVVLRYRIFKGKSFFDVLDTRYLTPEFQPDNPDELLKVTELYKIKGEDLRAAGYAIADDKNSVSYWFRREWDDKREIWFNPKEVIDEKGKNFTEDTTRTVDHKLDFVPLIWIKNLPGCDEVDGEPTFSDELVETGIEIEYLLSQNGRGLKYASQPTTVITSDNKQGPVPAGDTILLPSEGDAKLLEIGGGASEAVVNFVRFLRELALEAGGGNRTDASKLGAAKSGRAMELMLGAVINVASKLRKTYGDGALLPAIRMMLQAQAKLPLVFRDGLPIPKIAANAALSLNWPSWQAPTTSDINELASAFSIAKTAGLVSTETAVKNLSSIFDVDDIPSEVAAIEKEASEAAALQASIKAPVAKPDKTNE
jgi:hypothetical protein